MLFILPLSELIGRLERLTLLIVPDKFVYFFFYLFHYLYFYRFSFFLTKEKQMREVFESDRLGSFD